MEKIKDNPTVSVIMPTQNRAHVLGEAIQSVLNQTYRNFEFIIVDDASNDNTDEVVRGFKDERIRYTRLEKSLGTSAVARNIGIKMARGKYIAQQDDDALWQPEKLEKQVKAMEAAPAEVGVVYTGLLVLTDSEKIYLPSQSITEKEGDVYKQILREYFSVNPPVLARRECFERVGMYDEKLSALLDWDMWMRVAKYYQFRFIDELLVSTYYSPDTSHYGKIAFIKGYIAVLDKHFREYVEIDKELLAKGYFEYGLALCLVRDSANYAEGRRYLWKAFKLSPLRLRYGLGFTASLLRLAVLYNHALLCWDAPFKRLRPLIEKLRPILGWTYPFLNKVSEVFLLR